MATIAVAPNESSVREAPFVPDSIAVRRAQLADLMRTCGDSVLQICQHALNDADAARDLRQEIFVRAFEKLSDYRGEGPMRNWLLAMAKKRAIDATRAKTRWWKRFASWQPQHEATAAPAPPEDDRDEGRLLRALADCVKALPAHHRMTVLLRYKRGMTYPQIAAIGEEAPSAVHERVARVLPRLRKCVESKDVPL